MFRIACDFDRPGSRFRTTVGGPLLAVLFSLAAGCGGDPTGGNVVTDPDACLICNPFAACDPKLANPCICPEGLEGDGTVDGSGCSDTSDTSDTSEDTSDTYPADPDARCCILALNALMRNFQRRPWLLA